MNITKSELREALEKNKLYRNLGIIFATVNFFTLILLLTLVLLLI